MLKVKDKSLLLSLKFSGKGGKEKEITKLFPTLLRKDTKKLDFICREESVIYEAKKQQDQQWFNLSKFYNLGQNEQKINLLFICFDPKNGLADIIFCIEKGDFLKLLIDNKSLRDYGWSLNAIEKAHDLVNIAPKLQPKVCVGMRKFYRQHCNEVKTIYKKWCLS